MRRKRSANSEVRMNVRRYSYRVGLLGTVLAAMILMSACGKEKRSSGEESSENKSQPNPTTAVMDAAAQRNIGLQTGQAEKRPVVELVNTTGAVGANDTRVAELRALASGRVLKVNVRLGQRVRAGEVLAIYDNVELGDLTGQYDVARANLKKAETDAEVTAKSLQRAQNLVGLGALAQAEVERRRAESSASMSAIDTQRAELAKIEEKLHRFGLSDPEIRTLENRAESHREVSRTSLTAPFDGVITKYEIAVGEFVDTSRALFSIADLSTVWVQADVYEKDISLIRNGATAKVRVDAYPNEVFQGRITYISDVLDPKTRTARVRCEVSNPDGRLKLEMFAMIELPTPRYRDAVMVPDAAIQQINDKPVVFVPKSATDFERREVTVASRNGQWVEIPTGLTAGEKVVTKGSFDLKSALLRAQIGGEE